jgi:hypothetical protein
MKDLNDTDWEYISKPRQVHNVLFTLNKPFILELIFHKQETPLPITSDVDNSITALQQQSNTVFAGLQRSDPSEMIFKKIINSSNVIVGTVFA